LDVVLIEDANGVWKRIASTKHGTVGDFKFELDAGFREGRDLIKETSKGGLPAAIPSVEEVYLSEFCNAGRPGEITENEPEVFYLVDFRKHV